MLTVPFINLDRHEGHHNHQGEKYGPAYLPMMLYRGVANPNNPFEIEAENHSRAK